MVDLKSDWKLLRRWQRWGTNDASCWIFLLNHVSRRTFSPIARNVKRSKYIANFTFSTLKASLKRKTLPIQPQKYIGKYVTSHAKTFLMVSVRTAERTSSKRIMHQWITIVNLLVPRYLKTTWFYMSW